MHPVVLMCHEQDKPRRSSGPDTARQVDFLHLEYMLQVFLISVFCFVE